ncbi:MAG: beta-ketoacyl-[Bacteroidales bacterium]|nr:beta-ketoacyl-[acyl-carrier-protein] synthase family protein [Bacteroidales bacterium]
MSVSTGQNKGIAITGCGIVSSIGTGKEAVAEALRSGRPGIRAPKHLATVHKELPVGEVDLSNEELRALAGISQGEEISRTILLGIIAAKEALEQAGLSGGAKGKRIALVSGTTVGGMDMTEKFYRTGEEVSPEYANCLNYHDCGGCTAGIATHFGIFSFYTTVSTACSSAANAIAVGADLLKTGKADIVLAGGTEALSKFHLNGFNSLMILDSQPCRPFDALRAGLNLGEGAAYLVLEPAGSSELKPLAWLTGYGISCDAFHQTASSDNGEGAFLAMREALLMAGMKPSQIDYINAHGTGTENNDRSESAAVIRLFGDAYPPISSTKSYTGHTTSASGSIEAVICLLAMQGGFIPASLGWENPMPGGVIPTLGKSGYTLKNVMCNSFGFGGNDTSLIFSSAPQEPQPLESHKAVLLSREEISDAADLSGLSEFIKPMEARRMDKLMRGAMLVSLRALKAAGLEKPDAIIAGTSLGSLESSMLLLNQMLEEGESTLKPTLFMQSTHNTMAGSLAIRLGCHGCNLTFSQRDESLYWAEEYARLLIATGRSKTVLVGCFDTSTPRYNKAMGKDLPLLHVIAKVFGRED